MKLLLLFLLTQTPGASAHQTVLNWSASGTTGATYNVYKQPACTGSFTKAATGLTVLTWTDTGLADGAVTCYYITAQAPGAAESSPSNTIKAITPSSTPAPAVTLPPGTATSAAS